MELGEDMLETRKLWEEHALTSTLAMVLATRYQGE